MLLEIARFASLLLSILSLDALFHTAFLDPASHFEQRLVPALGMLCFSAAICLASGYIFHAWDVKTGRRDGTIARSLPMLIFWWGAGLIILLYSGGWVLNTYFFGLKY